jgi:hypothetical protein
MNELDPRTFFFEIPLYSPVTITEENKSQLLKLLGFSGQIDEYNPFINDNTTYRGYSYLTTDKPFFLSKGGVRHLSIQCQRTGMVFDFYVHYDPDTNRFMKIGQYPSIADFHISHIKKYNKILSKDKLKEFTRAIGLAANGVGIGSFVYLRRIFEDLIEEAHSKAKSEAGWDDEVYQKGRIKERIELLKNYVPNFLFEHRELYGILSVGVHSLKEEECLAYFDTVKVGIEIILDEKLEDFAKQQKIKDAKEKLTALTTKIGDKQKVGE